MKRLRIAAVALNQTPLSWDENRDNILGALAEARALGASLVCLPEMAVSGYGCEDAFLWPATREMALTVLGEVAPATRGLVVTVGFPLTVDDHVVSAAAVLVDGRLVGVGCKRHLPREGLHYEPRWFWPWPTGLVRELSLLGAEIPVGDLVFDVGGVRIGFEICEDAWVTDRPGHELAKSGVDVVVSPSASHFAFGKSEKRKALALSGAAEFGATYVYSNLLGNEAGRAIYDGDCIVAVPEDDGASILAEAPRLTFAPRTVLVATTRLLRRTLPNAPSRRIVSVPFAWPEVSAASASPATTGEQPRLAKEIEFTRAVSLGLFDYLRKSRSRGFVVSLSGGADSAAVALLVRSLVRFGVAELGFSGFVERLGPSLSVPAPSSEAGLVSALLTTVYQATKNSSNVTREAAREVAHALGSRHFEVDVEHIVDAYTRLAEGALGRHLTWEHDDIALQNVQARVRAPLVWMLANVDGALLLSTSNRSEAAVGYATMDGDTSGGLAPIAGIDKAFLLRWLEFMRVVGPPELGPVPALCAVTEQQPTAELRPSHMSQTDETDLMPYVVLDFIERLAVVERLSPREVDAALAREFGGHSRKELRTWLVRFYRLFARSQWKRERYAPSFHVDDANLDPKTWCRFPILSGGFERELRELDPLTD